MTTSMTSDTSTANDFDTSRCLKTRDLELHEPELHQAGRVIIIGAGAIGAPIAVRMHEQSPGSVAVAASGARRDRLIREGLVVNGIRHTIPVKDADTGLIWYCDRQVDACDPELIMVAVKSIDLLEAVDTAAALAFPKTVVLSLLNGISSEELLRTRFAPEKVLYALAAGQDAVRDERGVVFDNAGKIFFGNLVNDPAALSPEVVKVQELLTAGGVAFETPMDMERTLWWKFMVNVGINQASAILRAPYKEFHRPGKARELMDALISEVVELSRRMRIGCEGTGLSDDDVERWYSLLATLGPERKTSMLQDVEAGRRTEVDLFGETVIRLASTCGLEVPWNREVTEALLR